MDCILRIFGQAVISTMEKLSQEAFTRSSLTELNAPSIPKPTMHIVMELIDGDMIKEMGMRSIGGSMIDEKRSQKTAIKKGAVMPSINDINRPATLAEIADVLGVTWQAVKKRAKKGAWKYTVGANKQQFYAMKDLPQDIQYAIVKMRKDAEIDQINKEKKEKNNAGITTTTAGNARGNMGRNRRNGEEINHSSTATPFIHDAERVESKQIAQCNSSIASEVSGSFHGNREGIYGTASIGFDRVEQRAGDSNKNGVIGSKKMDMGVSLRHNSSPDTTVNSQRLPTTEKQREIGLAIGSIMRWIDGQKPASTAQALMILNKGYKDGTLEGFLVYALERCKQKASGVSKTDDILTMSTVDKWRARYKKQNNYIPMVRQKDTTIKPWHIDLDYMLTHNPQGKTIALMCELLQGKYPDINAGMMRRWIREHYCNMALIKGRNTGMQRRAKQAYQPRTSKDMEPWDELHADGWNTHFTAPHPVTGEYVTYEIWDFHDVATRYIPPLSIGLTECYEVIAKGIENALRDNGVMGHLQCDSTKIIKNNKNFVGDDVTSISNVVGFEIVHPKAVGNAQANGIAENWHAWADKQCRILATYQAKPQDSLTLRNVKKIAAKMVKAAAKEDFDERDKLKAQAEKIGGGILLCSYQEAVDWIEVNLRQKWNNKPHQALKKVPDPEKIGRMRHQTPQEALDEHKARGWEPDMMSEEELQDVFIKYFTVKIDRGMVKPYGGMLYRHPILDQYTGEKVKVGVAFDDSSKVWVKTLKGELICVANFLEATGYRSETARENVKMKRAQIRIKNNLKKNERIAAENGLNDDSFIEGEALIPVEPLPIDRPEPLKRVTDIVGFNEPEIKERQMTREETLAFLYGNDEENQNNGQAAKN